MSSKEKAELLKETIKKLYSNEGRSISYISRLLDVNRKTVSDKIKEWDLPVAKHVRYLTPSNQKFLNKHKSLIKSRLDNDISIANIAKELNVTRNYIQATIVASDKVLTKAQDDYRNRKKETQELKLQTMMDKSKFDYNIIDIDNEVWVNIKGYDNYMVSNMGRVKCLSKTYNEYFLMTPVFNVNNKRMYITLVKDKKRKNMQLARIVAHAFVNGHSETNNTVNHEDGDVQNNVSNNLSWVSQSQNNTHAYRELGRPISNERKYIFTKIIYKNKYEFKTISSLARFINKSETQTRRYLDNPEKHDIQLIK